MSQIYFSKSAGGFFIEGVHSTIPADRVAVTADVWQHLITDQSPTSELSADPAGNPQLIDPTQDRKVIYSSVSQS